MMDNTLELIFNSCFTFSIPVWVLLVVVILACWLLYWDKNFRLRINGKPRLVDVTYRSFTIEWDKPTFAVPSHYMVYYRKKSEDEKWECITTKDRSCSLEITDLPLNTEFVVKVRACTNTEHGPTGDESSPITTKNLAYKIKDNSTERPKSANSLSLFDVRYQEELDEELKIRTITIGESSEDDQSQLFKSILMVSTPHSGKTTLLQGMMNYILGVTYHDSFRLGLVPEITDKSHQYEDWATVYQFVEHTGGRIGLPLMLIDIPRLRGSTREYIKRIYEQLISISGERGIHCICVVAQANNFNLPHEQIEYIQAIGHLFDDNATRDMFCFITFADSGPAYIESLLESHEITFHTSYFVNCSAFYGISKVFSPLFWKSNINSFDDFFNHLKGSAQKTMRLDLGDTDVSPERREELMSNIANLQPEVSVDLQKLHEIKNDVTTFTAHKEVILSLGDFSYTIEEIKQIKTPLSPGLHVTNCTSCFYTCHDNCIYKDDHEKINCTAMRSDGHCEVCTGHCKWDLHKNMPFIYEYESVQVTKSYKEMKTSYENKTGKKLEFDEYLDHLNKDIEALLARLHDKVRKISNFKNELQGIQKSPLAGSIDNTIDEMIQAENLKKENGYERRIEMFLQLKKYTGMIKIRKTY